MALLPFVSDSDFLNSIRAVFQIAEAAKSKSDKEFGKNVIDPFSVLFEMAGFGYDQSEWLRNEKTRQAQKTLSNSIGDFHQRIIGSLTGWKWHPNGEIIDVSNNDKKIIAEVKNKFNTTKGSDKVKIYDTLDNAVMPKQSLYKDYTAYYVEIIPKTPVRYNKAFTPSDSKTGNNRQENHLIRQIDGFSFYHLATGFENALELLYKALPEAIEAAIPQITISEQNREFGQKYFNAAYLDKKSKKSSKS